MHRTFSPGAVAECLQDSRPAATTFRSPRSLHLLLCRRPKTAGFSLANFSNQSLPNVTQAFHLLEAQDKPPRQTLFVYPRRDATRDSEIPQPTEHGVV